MKKTFKLNIMEMKAKLGTQLFYGVKNTRQKLQI